jgi:hypothetical protein
LWSALLEPCAQGLLDSEAALTLVVWPTDKVLIASEACADEGGPKARTEQQRLRALELVDAGWSWAQTGREVGVPKTTIGTWIRKRRDAR